MAAESAVRVIFLGDSSSAVRSVSRLETDARVAEIARMMGGAAAGEKALASARELLDSSEAKGESERRKWPQKAQKTQKPKPQDLRTSRPQDLKASRRRDS